MELGLLFGLLQAVPKHQLKYISGTSYLQAYNLFTWKRASKDHKRSLQKQVSDEVYKERANKKREWTQMINPKSTEWGVFPPPLGFRLITSEVEGFSTRNFVTFPNIKCRIRKI